MTPTHSTHHAAHVEQWLAGSATDLSTSGLIALLERALVALWRGANATLGEVTLTAIVDRVLHEASGQYPFVSITRIDGAEVRFEVCLRGAVQRDRRLRDVIQFALAEFLTVLGHLTDEILTPALHGALAGVRRDERDSIDSREDTEDAEDAGQ